MEDVREECKTVLLAEHRACSMGLELPPGHALRNSLESMQSRIKDGIEALLGLFLSPMATVCAAACRACACDPRLKCAVEDAIYTLKGTSDDLCDESKEIRAQARAVIAERKKAAIAKKQ